jgi:hypothetical protein
MPAKALAALCILLLAAPAAAQLTSGNSVVIAFGIARATTAEGIGCDSPTNVELSLPAGASGIQVVKPRMGDRDRTGQTRVTSVNVTGTVITYSVVADDPAVCEPGARWVVDYAVRADYTRRIQATIRVYYESYLHGAKWKIRPSTIRDTRAGAPPGDRISGIKWKRFGGKTAEGVGILHLDYCRRGDNCPYDGKRARLFARNAELCRDSGKVEYRDLAVYLGKLRWSEMHIDCG